MPTIAAGQMSSGQGGKEDDSVRLETAVSDVWSSLYVLREQLFMAQELIWSGTDEEAQSSLSNAKTTITQALSACHRHKMALQVLTALLPLAFPHHGTPQGRLGGVDANSYPDGVNGVPLKGSAQPTGSAGGIQAGGDGGVRKDTQEKASKNEGLGEQAWQDAGYWEGKSKMFQDSKMSLERTRAEAVQSKGSEVGEHAVDWSMNAASARQSTQQQVLQARPGMIMNANGWQGTELWQSRDHREHPATAKLESMPPMPDIFLPPSLHTSQQQHATGGSQPATPRERALSQSSLSSQDAPFAPAATPRGQQQQVTSFATSVSSSGSSPCDSNANVPTPRSHPLVPPLPQLSSASAGPPLQHLPSTPMNSHSTPCIDSVQGLSSVAYTYSGAQKTPSRSRPTTPTPSSGSRSSFSPAGALISPRWISGQGQVARSKNASGVADKRAAPSPYAKAAAAREIVKRNMSPSPKRQPSQAPVTQASVPLSFSSPGPMIMPFTQVGRPQGSYSLSTPPPMFAQSSNILSPFPGAFDVPIQPHFILASPR